MERARFFVIFIKKGVQEVEKITNFLKLKRYFAEQQQLFPFLI